MSENKIVAAVLTASWGGKGAYDDVPGAVATYRAVLKELKEPAPKASSAPKKLRPARGKLTSR
jgi:hypothetical protein